MIKPVLLLIMDGWGIAPSGPGNAVTLAKIPNLNKLTATYLHGQLQASGEAVGLPHGVSGNSETGHLNLGAGKIVYQDLPHINLALADGSFYKNSAFLGAVSHCKNNNSNLHLLGLIGQGSVHSNMEHLFSLLKFCKEEAFSRVFLHLFTDGRDSPPNAASIYLDQIISWMKSLETGQIATIMGRYYAMDRDNHWERTEIAYNALTKETGEMAIDPKKGVSDAYQKGITDEFIKPLIISGTPRIKENDAAIFFNFRIDRPRQLTKAFVIDDLKKLIGKRIAFDPYAEEYYKKSYYEEKISDTFSRGAKIDNLFFVTMTEYEADLPVKVAFPPLYVDYPLGNIISDKGLSQLRLSESEKERFVTYYFDGLREVFFPGTEKNIIPSPRVATYDLKPEMSAYELTDTLLDKLNRNTHHFIVMNFANPDMVGHTGVITAGIKACETVDECIGKILKKMEVLDGTIIITADHGNVEEMINLKTGKIDTEHSFNPVPLIIVNKQYEGKSSILPSGILGDIAPTVLSLLDIPIPSSMTGCSLLP